MINPSKILPPYILAVLLCFCIVVQIIFHPSIMFGGSVKFGGFLLIVMGVFLVLWTHKLFVKNGTPVKHNQKPTFVVLEGPYRVTRNPMYIGVLTLLLGLGLLVGTWPFLLLPVVMFISLQTIYIPWEEKRMTELFGKVFEEYLNSTRRWI